MKIEIFNDFHKTSAFVILKQKINKSCGYVSKRAVNACRMKLCGIYGCTCGTDEMGGRGNGTLNITPMGDGSVCINVEI